jgi:hypothetical protein
MSVPFPFVPGFFVVFSFPLGQPLSNPSCQNGRMKNETVLFDTVTPHPAPVALSDLLTEIKAVIKKHVILNDHAAAALAVWVLHTYTFELRDTVAYVAIESPEKRCGKTTLLSVLAAMAHRPLISSNITVGALFRAIHNYNPALFIDEADTFLAGNSIMRGIINSGNTRRTAYVLRSVGRASRQSETRTVGQASSLPIPNSSTEIPETGIKKFSCWCPKVISMIGEAPDTIADRSIVVKMTRKLTTETCAPLAALDTVEIRSKCARFALDAHESTRQHPKISGQGLNDCAADTFDPLYVIARHAGSDWENKLHAAALSLSSIADSENSGTALLLDILDVFFEYGGEKIFSHDLVAGLREGATASQTLKYSAINEFHISKMLRRYGVKPATIRIGKVVRNGYHAADFREALKRYVSREDAEARIEGAGRRAQLQEEAQAEARKEADLINQVLASSPHDKLWTAPEAMAKLRELQKLSHNVGKTESTNTSNPNASSIEANVDT